MNSCRCNGSDFCKIIGITAALIFGIAVGLLYFFGVFTAIAIPLTTILAFGFVGIAGVTAISLFAKGREITGCLCRLKGTLLSGAIGTFILSLAALAVSLTTGSVLSAVVIGVVGFFLALLIAGLVCLVSCAANCD